MAISECLIIIYSHFRMATIPSAKAIQTEIPKFDCMIPSHGLVLFVEEFALSPCVGNHLQARDKRYARRNENIGPDVNRNVFCK